MKKSKIILISVIVLAFAFVFSYAFASGFKTKPSDYHIGVSYTEAIKSEKPMLVLFYVDWCSFCLKFMPRYKTVCDLYKNEYNVVMLNAEEPVYYNLVKDIGLTSFPTIYIIDPKYDNRILINNAYYGNLKKLRIELDRYVRIRHILDSAKKS